ncbi:BnaCnng04740D [Brassica napus]|uniref:(rape) hypothetical protein n=1 Tax=Brassica napus TaxID=3708 RepID=A0A078GGU7_BRANA|nr:unnamed protein product [Brassica napus]CDY24407.1 BnaCnng04740D [Brassica napus]
MTPPAMNLVEHEGQMIASPPAIVSPPASGPLAVEEDAGDITVEEEAVDEHEIDEEAPDDDSYKGPTFVRSLVTLVHNSANTLVDHLDRKSCSPPAHQAHETLGESSIATPSEVAIATPFTESHEVHSTSCSEIDVTIPTLAAASVALSYSPIMEVIPSQSIISEDPESFVNEQQIVHTAQTTHISQQFYRESETPITYEKGSGFEVVGAFSSYNTTRGGRAIKPTQKLQEMEWTNVGGRGKKGRRGRGYNNH